MRAKKEEPLLGRISAEAIKQGIARKSKGSEENHNGGIDHMDGTVQCIPYIHKPSKECDQELSRGRYSLWRQEQRARAAKLQKQLKAKWRFEVLIEEQLNRFYLHYHHGVIPTKMKDVTQLLTPKWASALELVSLASWFGEWRPSAILELVRILISGSRTSCSGWNGMRKLLSCPSTSSTMSDSNDIQRRLSQLINEIRIEEAIIDEEMAEIQATCVFHLPFAPAFNGLAGTAALTCIEDEFKKIAKVITKAQKLRFKTLEVVLTKVLSETEAAEFLVAFAAIQDMIHQFTAKSKGLISNFKCSGAST